jgi:hypothetical protein
MNELDTETGGHKAVTLRRLSEAIAEEMLVDPERIDYGSLGTDRFISFPGKVILDQPVDLRSDPAHFSGARVVFVNLAFTRGTAVASFSTYKRGMNGGRDRTLRVELICRQGLRCREDRNREAPQESRSRSAPSSRPGRIDRVRVAGSPVEPPDPDI